MSVVVITRDSADSSTRGQRVYVTGPHFGIDVFSSTFDIAQASRYEPDEAARLVRTKWLHLNARVEKVIA